MNVRTVFVLVGVLTFATAQSPLFGRHSGAPKDIKSEQSLPEAYYFLSSTGTITLGEETTAVSPGTVAIIPAGIPHSLEAAPHSELEFVIFGTPPMLLKDEKAKPKKV